MQPAFEHSRSTCTLERGVLDSADCDLAVGGSLPKSMFVLQSGPTWTGRPALSLTSVVHHCPVHSSDLLPCGILGVFVVHVASWWRTAPFGHSGDWMLPAPPAGQRKDPQAILAMASRRGPQSSWPKRQVALQG